MEMGEIQKVTKVAQPMRATPIIAPEREKIPMPDWSTPVPEREKVAVPAGPQKKEESAESRRW